MREIKFKFLMENGEITDTYYLKELIDSYSYINIECEYSSKIKQELQYTGLNDKNGKEIYEGDVVKIEKCFTNGVDKLSDHIGEIKYSNCRFFAIDEYLNSLCPYTYKNQIEVIGNIYKNPELLKS